MSSLQDLPAFGGEAAISRALTALARKDAVQQALAEKDDHNTINVVLIYLHNLNTAVAEATKSFGALQAAIEAPIEYPEDLLLEEKNEIVRWKQPVFDSDTLRLGVREQKATEPHPPYVGWTGVTLAFLTHFLAFWRVDMASKKSPTLRIPSRAPYSARQLLRIANKAYAEVMKERELDLTNSTPEVKLTEAGLRKFIENPRTKAALTSLGEVIVFVQKDSDNLKRHKVIKYALLNPNKKAPEQEDSSE